MLAGLPGQDKEKETCQKPFFHAFKLFSNNSPGAFVDMFVDCGTFHAGGFCKNIPYLDATSVHSKETKSPVINVVNRRQNEAIRADIGAGSGTFSGKASVGEINSNDARAV